VNRAAVDPNNRQMAESLFSEMKLRGEPLRLAWMAFDEYPEGTVEIALASFEGRNPAGLFTFKREQGEHRTGPAGQRRTGWTMKRGTHGCSYVRDPKGVDVLPAGHEQ
jgi:hypothetical protein